MYDHFNLPLPTGVLQTACYNYTLYYINMNYIKHDEFITGRFGFHNLTAWTRGGEQDIVKLIHDRTQVTFDLGPLNTRLQ